MQKKTIMERKGTEQSKLTASY